MVAGSEQTTDTGKMPEDARGILLAVLEVLSSTADVDEMIVETTGKDGDYDFAVRGIYDEHGNDVDPSGVLTALVDTPLAEFCDRIKAVYYGNRGFSELELTFSVRDGRVSWEHREQVTRVTTKEVGKLVAPAVKPE
jgi:hypothetical protein